MKNDVAFQIYDLQHRLINEFRGNHFTLTKPGIYILIAKGEHRAVQKLVLN